MVFVLGLHGPALAGKDTVADYLIAEHGWTAKLSFARNLKDICKRVFYLTEHDVNTQEGKRQEFSSPLEFTSRNLGSVMFLMAQTHPDAVIAPEAMAAVRSLVGTTLTSPRHVLQFVGTEICRALVPTYHVDIIAQRVAALPSQAKVAITDVRFPNEGEIIVDRLGGMVVRVLRPGLEGGNIDREHPSETAMRDWGRFCAELNNDKDGLTNLYRTVDAFLEEHGPCQALIQ